MLISWLHGAAAMESTPWSALRHQGHYQQQKRLLPAQPAVQPQEHHFVAQDQVRSLLRHLNKRSDQIAEEQDSSAHIFGHLVTGDFTELEPTSAPTDKQNSGSIDVHNASTITTTRTDLSWDTTNTTKDDGDGGNPSWMENISNNSTATAPATVANNRTGDPESSHNSSFSNSNQSDTTSSKDSSSTSSNSQLPLLIASLVAALCAIVFMAFVVGWFVSRHFVGRHVPAPEEQQQPKSVQESNLMIKNKDAADQPNKSTTAADGKSTNMGSSNKDTEATDTYYEEVDDFPMSMIEIGDMDSCVSSVYSLTVRHFPTTTSSSTQPAMPSSNDDDEAPPSSPRPIRGVTLTTGGPFRSGSRRSISSANRNRSMVRSGSGRRRQKQVAASLHEDHELVEL